MLFLENTLLQISQQTGFFSMNWRNVVFQYAFLWEPLTTDFTIKRSFSLWPILGYDLNIVALASWPSWLVGCALAVSPLRACGVTGWAIFIGGTPATGSVEGQSTWEAHHPRGFVLVSGEHKRRNSDLIMGGSTRNCEVEVDRDIVLFDIVIYFLKNTLFITFVGWKDKSTVCLIEISE